MKIAGDNTEAEMSDRPPAPAGRESIRIVDLIFAGEPRGGRRRLALGGLIVMVLYAGVFTSLSHLGRSAGPWSAEMAERVHDAIAVERAVDVTPPPPPLPPPTSPAAVPAIAAPRVARTTHAATARPVAPAQAGKIVAVSLEPIDFTGAEFVVGSGPTYAGGTTTSTGTGRTPTHGTVAPEGTGEGSPAVPGRARAVSLDQAAWNCPWPAEADAQQVNEQTVILTVSVRTDGRVDRVDVLSDPEFGFGAAARLCALRTQFEPARDPGGHPVVALSPPIRVHFFR